MVGLNLHNSACFGESYLLIKIGTRFGALNTLLLIVLTGIVGAALARIQGLAVLRDIQETMALGQIPAQALVEGVCVLFCGALLVTPGMITDVFGVLAMMPVCRRPLARKIQDYFKERIIHGNHSFDASQVVIDMEPPVTEQNEETTATLAEHL